MLVFFLCCQSQVSFPRWEEGVCMVQCILLPKLLMERESCSCEVPCLGAVGGFGCSGAAAGAAAP